MIEQPSHLSLKTGERLAYRYTPGRSPTVVFLSGYASDMSGSKAVYLESIVTGHGHAFLRLDYSGHGLSDGDFVDGSIGRWSDDAVAVVSNVTDGPLILVGSSMGGWIMLLVARRLIDRVVGLLGIAAAPDFTEDLMWRELDAEQRDTLLTDGEIYLDSDYVDDPYPITRKLIDDGRDHLQLSAPIPLRCPVRLIHGLADPDVPRQTSLTLADSLKSTDVLIKLIKDGGHRLSEAEQLVEISSTLISLFAGQDDANA